MKNILFFLWVLAILRSNLAHEGCKTKCPGAGDPFPKFDLGDGPKGIFNGMKFLGLEAFPAGLGIGKFKDAEGKKFGIRGVFLSGCLGKLFGLFLPYGTAVALNDDGSGCEIWTGVGPILSACGYKIVGPVGKGVAVKDGKFIIAQGVGCRIIGPDGKEVKILKAPNGLILASPSNLMGLGPGLKLLKADDKGDEVHVGEVDSQQTLKAGEIEGNVEQPTNEVENEPTLPIEEVQENKEDSQGPGCAWAFRKGYTYGYKYGLQKGYKLGYREGYEKGLRQSQQSPGCKRNCKCELCKKARQGVRALLVNTYSDILKILGCDKLKPMN